MWGAAASGPLSAAHSRVRLRAPDEVESETSADASAAGRGASSAAGEPGALAFKQEVPLRPSAELPHLDVGSPDYIEERLENLKRRPTWASYLDQYVEAFSDDENDEAEPEYYARKVHRQPARRFKNSSGFLASLTWSTLVLALWPILLLLYPFLRHKGQGFWPMDCNSMGHLLSRSLLNVLFLLFGLLLLYWAICRELPELDADNMLILLDVRLAHLLDAGHTCQIALQQFEVPLVRELCTGAGIDTAFVVATGWLVFHCHRRWARYAMTAMAVVFFFDGPTRLYDATFPAPMINHIDPTYAMVDEEITIAVDGQNLKPGGHIAWVSYWGCATTSDVATCEKQFSSVFSLGVVHVTFKSIDHFIPCYRDPPNPLKAQEYVCFPGVRIRVKDKQSIPGWSKIQQPAPAVAVVPNAASTQVLAASIETSERPALVENNADETMEHVEEESVLLEGVVAVEDAESDGNSASISDIQSPESTDQDEELTPDDDLDELRPTDDTDAFVDGANTSEHPDRSSSINDEQLTPSDSQSESEDLSTDEVEPQLPDDQQQATSTEALDGGSFTMTDDQSTEFETADAQEIFDVTREDEEIEGETNDLVEVEVHTAVKELLQSTDEKGVAVVAQASLIEVEIEAEGPSSLTLVIDEASLNAVSAQNEPEPVTTSEQPAIEKLTILEAKQEPPVKQAKEPIKSRPTSSKLVALDDIEVAVTLEQKPSEEQIARRDAQIDPNEASIQPSEEKVTDSPTHAKGTPKHKLSETDRQTQNNQRDRRRVQEREHSSISSIRVDRRGSQTLPRSIGQPPTTAR